MIQRIIDEKIEKEIMDWRKKRASIKKIIDKLGLPKNNMGLVKDVIKRYESEEPNLRGIYLPNDNLPPQYCHSCNALVHMPCLACQLRRMGKVKAPICNEDSSETLEYDLKGEQLAIFEAIKKSHGR